MSNLVTDYGCQTVPGTNQMPLQFSPIWRCNFLHFGLQLLVILLYNKHPYFASCNITVNGKHVDTICYEPYMFDARLKTGENVIEIEATTTLYNLMGPNWNVNMPEAEFVGPNQFVDKTSFTERLTLLPFGLDGIAEVVTQDSHL